MKKGKHSKKGPSKPVPPSSFGAMERGEAVTELIEYELINICNMAYSTRSTREDRLRFISETVRQKYGGNWCIVSCPVPGDSWIIDCDGMTELNMTVEKGSESIFIAKLTT